MDLQLTGKRVFVSGSTQGIGRAVAAALLGEGASVIINGRDERRVESTVAALTSTSPGAAVSGLVADFTDARQVQRLIEQLGEVDVLVNNVGRFGVQPFTETADEEWRHYFELNVLSGVRLARHLLPGMLARGWGRIVFISSESGVDVPPDMAAYGVTKAAQLALANSLAKLTRGTAVTVNTILGGPTYSDGVAEAVTGIAKTQQLDVDELKAALIAQRNTSLLGRFIEPAEIANLVAYLASPVSAATNGAAVRADGGVLTGLL